MYGFSKELNLDPLIGLELNQICLGPYDIQFMHNGSGIQICVQGNIQVYRDNQPIAEWGSDLRWTSLNFQLLLGAESVAWSLPDIRTLEITYDNGLKLLIIDDSDQYETAQIYFDDKSLPTVIV